MDTTSKPRKPQGQVMGREGHPLEPLFAPRTVALIGATERTGRVGRTILWNLISSPFGGTVFPVNLKRSSVLGIRAYPTIAAVPEPVDLAVIVTPAPTIPAILRDCATSGVKTAIVISAGFRETGPEAVAIEHEMVAEARRGALRVVGPNCLGVMSPVTGLNATYAPAMARRGTVGFISQSGALCAAVLDWSLRANVGFSHFVSPGAMADVGWGDLIDYLGDDPRTRSIVIHMESVGDARAFLSASREVALTKPIIVLKAGRTATGARAAASHTGSLVGSDEVFDAACRRAGVLRVNSIAELFYMAEVLGKQPRPKGPRLTIVTNAGGPGVLAADALVENGGELAPISGDAMTAYRALLGPGWSRTNLVDVMGDADPQRYTAAIDIALTDPASDGVLVVLTPQALSDPTQTAEQVKQRVAGADKPVLASWMGGADVAAGESILNRANIPTFPYPDTAARVFAMMWRYSDTLRGLYETPVLPPEMRLRTARKERVDAIVQQARASGRPVLTEQETRQVLGEYGIPIVEALIADSADQAVASAAMVGYPVALKPRVGTVTRRHDGGGAQLHLHDPSEVRAAYERIRAAAESAGRQPFDGVSVQPMVRHDGCEVILGASPDPQFGPVLLFGPGGRLVGVHRDYTLALPPLNTTLARRMMERTRIHRALTGAAGGPGVDLQRLAELLVRFSYLVAEQRWIKEIDINPLVVSPDRLVALDARMVVHGADMTPDALPTLAIRPYPIQYVRDAMLRDGTPVLIRPIRPEDEPAMVTFHEGLSDRTVYFRYFHPLNLSQRVAHERLTRICFNDYDREIALVAEHTDAVTGESRLVAVGRLTKIHATADAEFAILVTDTFQGKGLGTELLGRLLDVAKHEGVKRVVADMLSENRDMQHICERHGFKVSYGEQTQMLHAVAVI
jgi:acetyltransferase